MNARGTQRMRPEPPGPRAAARGPRAHPIQGRPSAARTRPGRHPRHIHIVAAAAGISRSWLYTQPDIAGQIWRLREPASRAIGTAIPAAKRSGEASLRARLSIALQRNQALSQENAPLRRQPARALGDQRSARPQSGNDSPR